MTQGIGFCPFCTKPVRGEHGLAVHVWSKHRPAMEQLRLAAPNMPAEEWQRERATMAERIAQLEAQLYGTDWVSPPEIGLTAAQDALLSALLRHDRVLSEWFLFEATRIRATSANELHGKLIHVMISKIRKKFAPFGLEIRTVYGRGYCLAPETRQRLLNWPAQHPAQAA